MKISQHPEEIGALVEALEVIKPKIILEIGIDWGGTFSQWCKIAGADGLVIGVDREEKTAAKIETNCGDFGQAAKIIIGDSIEPETLAKVKDILSGRPVDFLFIDGDHSYKGVKSDHAVFSPLVKPGGVIAFHDIATPATIGNPYRKGTFCGVTKFWKELRAKNKWEFILEAGKPHKYGIGVIIKDG